MGKAPDEWSYGDSTPGFKNAALVLDETFVTPDTSHQCLETRTAMAYWQNGKVYVHTGTQSTAQTVPAIARWLNIDPDNVVFISEYTGGGFGSKITGGDHADHSRRCCRRRPNAPVMMRISREEEHYIGRARPSMQGRMKVGFYQGRPHHRARHVRDLRQRSRTTPVAMRPSSGRIVSLLYQPPAMRWRGITVLTNTPPRSAQSSPGGMQGIAIMEPILAKAARKLGVDQVAHPAHQLPRGQGASSDRRCEGKRSYATSASSRRRSIAAPSSSSGTSGGAQPKRSGTKVRGVGVVAELLRRRLDRLRRAVRDQARRPGRTSSPASATWERSR